MTDTHLTFVPPHAPIGTILDRLKQVSEQLVAQVDEYGEIEKAIIQQRDKAYQELDLKAWSATAIKQYLDASVSGFLSEAKEFEAAIECLRIEQVYLHTVLKYLHPTL